jgi:hypothetical protein
LPVPEWKARANLPPPAAADRTLGRGWLFLLVALVDPGWTRAVRRAHAARSTITTGARFGKKSGIEHATTLRLCTVEPGGHALHPWHTLPNREIGERLFLSHRTVGGHLHRIFPKLRISGRAHLRSVLK